MARLSRRRVKSVQLISLVVLPKDTNRQGADHDTNRQGADHSCLINSGPPTPPFPQPPTLLEKKEATQLNLLMNDDSRMFKNKNRSKAMFFVFFLYGQIKIEIWMADSTFYGGVGRLQFYGGVRLVQLSCSNLASLPLVSTEPKSRLSENLFQCDSFNIQQNTTEQKKYQKLF